MVDLLLHVLADELRHLEHRDLALAIEYRAKLVVRVDHAALLRILKSVPLDVLPQLLRDFGAWNRRAADDGRKGGVELHRPHERRVGFALRATTLRGLLPPCRLLGALPCTLFLRLFLRHAVSSGGGERSAFPMGKPPQVGWLRRANSKVLYGERNR